MSWQHWLFAAAGVFALAVIAIEPWRARRRIADALRGRPADRDHQRDRREHWRGVHLAADRRRPFHDSRTDRRRA